MMARKTWKLRSLRIQRAIRPLGTMSFIAALVLLAACGAPEPTPTPSPTATLVPTATSVPTPTRVAAWDYVALGDSTVAMSGHVGDLAYTFHYAGYVEADLGVEVSILNRAVSGYTSADLLDDIRNKEDWREVNGFHHQ